MANSDIPVAIDIETEGFELRPYQSEFIDSLMERDTSKWPFKAVIMSTPSRNDDEYLRRYFDSPHTFKPDRNFVCFFEPKITGKQNRFLRREKKRAARQALRTMETEITYGNL